MIRSVTSKAIMSRLAEGPATNLELQEVAYTHSGEIARRICDLRRLGHVIRIDGQNGRGHKARYALKGYSGEN